jgi:hypothetical protein
VYENNHYWTQARLVAIERDNFQCTRCGWNRHHCSWVRDGQLVFWSRTELLGQPPENWLEVNHIKPRDGAGYKVGCWNHQENLSTVCRRCHIKITRRQRMDRAQR